MALADAEELHQKIQRLRDRSATLEEALRTLQAAVSDDPHPLLQNDSDSPSSTAVDHSSSSSSPADGPRLSSEEERILDAFGESLVNLLSLYAQVLLGTLTLGLRGESRFYGQTSRSEVCLQVFICLLSNSNLVFLVLDPCKFYGPCCISR